MGGYYISRLAVRFHVFEVLPAGAGLAYFQLPGDIVGAGAVFESHPDQFSLCLLYTSEHCFVTDGSYKPISLKRKFPELCKAFEKAMKG